MQEGNFVELNYTGKTQEGVIFDTTDAEVAKKEGLQGEFKPIVICLGQSFVLPAIDEFLIGKEFGKEYSLTILPEKAFGKKDAKKIQLVPQSRFTKQEINPYPGLQVDVDGQMAVIRRVSGGRVLVDFNHPLAGQTVSYELKVLKEVTDAKEKLNALLERTFGKVNSSFSEGTATIETSLPKELESPLGEQITKLIPEIKKVEFKAEKKEESNPKNL
jgi:FKBP-type peptidyl-prolyl cis-trans isomerase SlyD